jgi:hypothetical protein
MVPDRLWNFQAPGRDHHPGACVRCDVVARLAFLCKGTDVGSARPDRYLYVTVEPSPGNGLSKPTAFALDPRRVRLHVLRCLHQGKELIGRLEDHYFCAMRGHFDAIVRLVGGASRELH